jgi:hypothetical protein
MAQEQLYLIKEDSVSQKDGDRTGKCCLMTHNTIIEAGLEMEQILEKIKLYQPRQIVTIRVCALVLHLLVDGLRSLLTLFHRLAGHAI